MSSPGICLRPPPGTQYSDQCTLPGSACEYGIAVYFGDGCFWHTQYDMYLVELGPSFGRGVENVTARVGYAGGFGAGPHGQVCYHNGPAGTLYGDMYYAEAAQVTLDPDSGRAACQFDALVTKYVTMVAPRLILPSTAPIPCLTSFVFPHPCLSVVTR